MGNSLSSTEPVEYVTFVCEKTYEPVKIPWSLLASKFKRFEDVIHKNSKFITSFPMRSFLRLAAVLEKGSVVIMNAEDVELMNWLQLRDFTDGYKLYATTPSSPFAPPPPVPDNTHPEIDDEGRSTVFRKA